MKNFVYTSIILIMGFLIAQGQEPLGDLLSAAVRNGVLFNDGRVNLTGTLSNADETLKINGSDATITANGIILNLQTSTDKDALKAIMAEGEIRRWNGGESGE